MKIRTTIAAVILTMSPALAFAMGCQGTAHLDQQASMSCAEGMTFDVDTNTCVAETTS